jgi:hypothetical protein
MTLLDMQRAFSRILTDASFQRAFLAGEQDALRAYDLTDRELLSLRGLRRDRLATHAKVLAATRVGRSFKTLPLTATLLRERLRPFVDRFCAEFPPDAMGAEQVLVESARLTEFVIRLLDEGLLTPPWAKDLVTYENIEFSLGMSQDAWDSGMRTAALNRAPVPAADLELLPLVPVHGEHARLAAFDHDLPEIIPRLAAGEIPEARPLDRPLRLLFVKVPGVLHVQTVKVNDATVALLAACDGRRTTAALLDLLAAELGQGAPGGRRAELDRLALPALRNLRELNVIAFQAFRHPAPADPPPPGA